MDEKLRPAENTSKPHDDGAPNQEAREHLRAAAYCLLPIGTEPDDASTWTLDMWTALHLLETALCKPGGDASRVVQKLVQQHADKAEHLRSRDWATTLKRTSKVEKIKDLEDDLREALRPDHEGPQLPSWFRAYVVIAAWAAVYFESDLYPDDALGCDPGVSVRFLAHVVIALPKDVGEQWADVARGVLDADGLPSHQQNEEAFDRLVVALDDAWPRSPERDAEWFLRRAVEALGEQPNELLAYQRARVYRRRRQK